MKKSHEKCSLVHDFEFFGYVTYRNTEGVTRFEVFVCKKCGFSEFFFAGTQKFAKNEASEPEIVENDDSDRIQDLSIG